MTHSPERLRSAIVGCGGIAGSHARVLADADDFELVAVCDLMEDRASELAAKFPGAKPYTELQEMLATERPDVVAVATASDTHARLTVIAAEGGARGVCCEKPMATCMSEGREMLTACRERGTSLIVNHQRRMSVALVEMRRLIEEGAIGDVYLIRGSCSGDMLSDGTHLIDSIRWLAGDEDVGWVLGQVYRDKPDPAEPRSPGYTPSGGWRYGHPVETGAIGVFEFNSGGRAEIFTGQMQLRGRRYQDYEVFGSSGRLWRRGDNADPAVLIQDDGSAGWRGVPITRPHGRSQPMADSYRAFAGMIRQGAPHPLCGDSALKDLEIITAVLESARTGRRVDLPLRQAQYPLQLMIEAGQV